MPYNTFNLSAEPHLKVYEECWDTVCCDDAVIHKRMPSAIFDERFMTMMPLIKKHVKAENLSRSGFVASIREGILRDHMTHMGKYIAKIENERKKMSSLIKHLEAEVMTPPPPIIVYKPSSVCQTCKLHPKNKAPVKGKPKKKPPAIQSPIILGQSISEIRKRIVVCESANKNFEFYNDTSIYLDIDTFFKLKTEKYEVPPQPDGDGGPMEALYDKMVELNSCHAMQFGNGNTYIIGSPIDATCLKQPNGENKTFTKGQGCDYNSVIKNLKNNKTAINKKCSTFVIPTDLSLEQMIECEKYDD